MSLSVLQLALQRVVSVAVALCMVLAFNLPTVNPAIASGVPEPRTVTIEVVLPTHLQGLPSVLFEGEHQDAAYSAGAQTGITISGAELGQVAGAAAAQWPGWAVGGAAVFVQDLPGDALAITSGNSIAVDPTAAGWGWSVGGPAPGTMDLFTVLAHEYGHIAGFGDIEGGADLMTRTLSSGERRYNSQDRMYPVPEPVVEPVVEPAALTVAEEPVAEPAPVVEPVLEAPDATVISEPAPADEPAVDPATGPTTDPVPAGDTGDTGDTGAEPVVEAPAEETPAGDFTIAATTGGAETSGTEAPAVGPSPDPTGEAAATGTTAAAETAATPGTWNFMMSGTSATLVFNADGTVTFGGETRNLADLTAITVTGTAGDDTFTIDRGAANPAITVTFDGALGFDTLATRGTTASSRSVAVDPHSGTLYLDSTVVH